ncbi:MAG: hypothetical protein A2Y73_09245 [Chloroflexi bacterium RBG_13_56_8]|nr:MAG: hypothetical protein A2Y73_09245 [Chloroflexi bacterium RBG_13_56_8]
MEEFYPMPLFVKLFVCDVEASAKWYENALGFRSIYALTGDKGVQVMNHLRLGRYQDLMLLPQSEDMARLDKGWGVAISLTLEDGINDLAQRAASAGSSVEGPTETPWNTRELTVWDPDGYMLTFSQVVDATRPFDEVIPPHAT